MDDPAAAARPVLVTGATGFVGSHLVELLSARDLPLRALVRPTSDVSLLDRLGVARVQGALGDPAALARAVEGTDVVVHLAALTRARTAAEYRRVNVDGTRALVDAVSSAERGPRRLVYLSSLAAAGPAASGRPVRADDVPRPLTDYGRSKLAGERVCLDAAGDDLRVVVLRAPAVYGPRDGDLFTYFRFAAQGLLPVPRGPERPVQLIHAADLAEALVRAATAPAAGGLYHVAEARAYPWEDVASLIAKAVDRPARVVRVPGTLVRAAAATTELAARLVGRAAVFNRDKARELLAPGWLCETDRASRELGFTARTPLPDGLMQTADWYRAQGWL